jgi:hypothetical protein
MNEILSKIKKLFCRHRWATHNFFIYSSDFKPKESMSDIKKGWFYEVQDYMDSIGLEDLWPYYFRECKKCGKQTTPGIDTLIKATIVDWYIPKYYDGTDIEGNYPAEVKEK